jgi:DNA polymerase III delta subunit
MIFIIHGEDFPTSRRFVTNLMVEKNASSKVELLIGETTPTSLFSHITAFDVFGAPPFVVLDISKAGRKKMDAYLQVLEKAPQDAVVVILSASTLSKSNAYMKSAKKLDARVMHNKKVKTSNVFAFVELVFSGKRKASYSELRRLLISGEDPFYIFSMLLYGIRNLAHIKFDSPNVRKMAPFVRQKYTAFSTHFRKADIKVLYTHFYDLDMGAKTGMLSPDLQVTLAVEKVLSFF